MRKLIKRILHPFLKFFYQFYSKKPRFYSKNGLKLKIYPGVFHPKFFISTQIFIDFIQTHDWQNKTVLELGGGSGAIGFFTEKKGAQVTISDISQMAIKGLSENKINIKSKAQIVQSDLFENIHDSFDAILINPPYYPKKPINEAEQAWFCGENFDYFKRLFPKLQHHLTENGKVWMILSEDCAIEEIKALAQAAQLSFNLIFTTRKLGEENYIFELY